MLRRLLSLFRRGDSEQSEDSDTESNTDDEDSGFLRSRLDESVMQAHGAGGSIEQDAEMDDVDEQVSELQEQMPDQEHLDTQYHDDHR